MLSSSVDQSAKTLGGPRPSASGNAWCRINVVSSSSKPLSVLYLFWFLDAAPRDTEGQRCPQSRAKDGVSITGRTVSCMAWRARCGMQLQVVRDGKLPGDSYFHTADKWSRVAAHGMELATSCKLTLEIMTPDSTAQPTRIRLRTEEFEASLMPNKRANTCHCLFSLCFKCRRIFFKAAR